MRTENKKLCFSLRKDENQGYWYERNRITIPNQV